MSQPSATRSKNVTKEWGVCIGQENTGENTREDDTFRLSEPVAAARPSAEHEERERRAPIRPAFDEIPERLADERTNERGPETPERRPEKDDANRLHENDACNDDVGDADEEQ